VNRVRLTQTRRRRSRLGPVLFGAVLVILLVIVALLVDAAASDPSLRVSSTAETSPEESLRIQLDRAQRYNRRLERILQREVSRAERLERVVHRTRHAARRALGTSPLGDHYLEDAFECLHHFEGGWRAATGNGYYGGLQMDWDFQRTYGRDYLRHFGPASNWPKSVQVAVAIKAWISRGFGPWPTTRRMCGL
jgi:Transglycosylase-like domain